MGTDTPSERLDEAWGNLKSVISQWRTACGDASQQTLQPLLEATKLIRNAVEASQAQQRETVALADSASGIVQTLRAAAAGETGARERVEALEQGLREREQAFAQAQSKVKQLEQQLAERVAAQDSAQQQLSKIQSLLTDTARAVEAGKERSKALEQKLAESDQSRRTLEGRITALEQELGAAKNSAGVFQSRITELETELEKRNSALATVQDELTQLQLSVESARRAGEQLAELEGLLQTERERADRLQAELDEETVHGTKSVLAQQLAQALEDNKRDNAELSALRQEVQRLKGEQITEPPPVADAKPSRTTLRRRSKKGSLGDVLVESNIITTEQLDAAIQIQKKFPQRSLAAVLISEGMANEEDIARALASFCGIEAVRIGDQNISDGVTQLVSGRLASLHSCIPIRATTETLTLAMSNPLDLVAIQDIERASGRRVEAVVVTPTDVQAAIQRFYPTA